jgi:hypothetical protein
VKAGSENLIFRNMDVTKTIGKFERLGGATAVEAPRRPWRPTTATLVICATSALLVYATARWWLAESVRDRRGAAALVAVVVWLLVLLVAMRCAWVVTRRLFPSAAAVLTGKLPSLRPRIVLACGSLFISLVAAEFVVRCWLPTAPLEWVANGTSGERQPDWEQTLCEFDPVLGWRGVPFRRGEFAIGGVNVSVAQNSDGFRDVEHDRSADRERRLVLLGDSFLWGAGVGQDETVSARLRHRLDDVEVYNLGVCGYGTDQSLLSFERWGNIIQPTVVCYLFFANDSTDNQSCTSHGHAKPCFTLVDGEPRLQNVPLAREAADAADAEQPADSTSPVALAMHPLRSVILAMDYSVSPHSVLYRHARRANLEWRRRQPPMDLDPLTAALILKLRARCDERRADFVMALIPDRGVMKYSNGPEHHASVRAWCAANQIDCLDLTPDLLASPANPYLFEGHWNATGHGIAADALAHYLENRGL